MSSSAVFSFFTKSAGSGPAPGRFRGRRAAVLARNTPVATRLAPDLLGGIVVPEAAEDPPLRLVPYSRWANRDPGPMAVWLAEP